MNGGGDSNSNSDSKLIQAKDVPNVNILFINTTQCLGQKRLFQLIEVDLLLLGLTTLETMGKGRIRT